MKKIYKILILSFFLLAVKAMAVESLSYSGRLVNANGSPVAGPVNLKIELAYTNAPTVVLCSQDFTNVPLSNGVFHLKLNFDCTPLSLHQVFSAIPANESAAVRVMDLTNSKAYAYQALHSVPFSYMSETAMQLTSLGATNGQVLKWNNTTKKWEPGNAGVGNGSVTSVGTGDGLTGGPVTVTGTISIADGGVTDIKVASGISRSKLAAGSASHVVTNDASGNLSSVAQLPIVQGGTGATTASDARTNLGLGTASVTNVGMGAGTVMTSSGVPECLPTEKLSMTLLPVNAWTCIADNDSADTSKLPLAGGQMSGDIDMNTNSITNLAAPTQLSDAATMGYVVNEIDALDTAKEDKVTAATVLSTGSITTNLRGGVILNPYGAGAGETGEVRFKELAANGANYIALRAPDVLGADYLFTLPGSFGTSGQVLTTSGASGILSWADVATSSTSVGGDLTGTIANAQIASGVVGSTEVQDGSLANVDIGNGANIDASKLGTGIVSNTELNYLDGLTSSIQTQLNSKIASSSLPTCGVGEVLKSDGSSFSCVTDDTGPGPFTGTADRVVLTDSSGNLVVSAVTNIEAGYLTGVTGAIQTQLNAKQATLTSTTDLLGDQLRIYNGANYVEVRSPVLGGNVVLTLPNSDGDANQVLQTDGSGNLAWVAIPSAPVTSVNTQTGAVVLTTTDVSEGTNQYFTGARVLSTVLTGLSTATNAVIAATDSVLVAFGKLQAQISGQSTSIANKADQTNIAQTITAAAVTGLTAPVAGSDATNKTYVDAQVASNASKWTVSGSDINRASGNVGIGVASPLYKLDVSGDVNVTGAFRINGTALTQGASISGGTSGVLTKFNASGNNVINSNIADNGTTISSTGGVNVNLDSNSFYLDAVNNRIGFLTAAPLYDLHLKNGSTVNPGVLSLGSSINSNGSVVARQYFSRDSANSGHEVIAKIDAIQSSAVGMTSGGRLSLMTKADGATTYSGVLIDQTGSVGIGTTSPGSALDVKGTLRLSGSTSGYVGLAPAAAAGSTTYTLPAGDGTSGQVLSTNGSGVMSWISPVGSVSSVFGRSGAVVATSGDYNASQVTNTAAGNIAATNVQTAINELDTEKQNVSTFAADVRAVVLTGLSTATNAVITATDSVLVAFGKLQAQISGQATTLSSKADQTNIAQTITAATVTGLTAPVAGSDATNKTYVDAQVASSGSKWALSGSDISRASGNVGIGTASPVEKLNVTGTHIKPVIGGVTAHTPLYTAYDSQNITALEIAATGANPSLGVLALTSANTASGDFIGSFAFATRGTSGADKRSGIISSSLDADSSTSVSGNLIFLTNTSGTISEKMRITSAGRIGVGTNSPRYKFDFGGANSAAMGFDSVNTSPNAGVFRFGDNTGWKLHFGRAYESTIAGSPAVNTGTTGTILTMVDSGNVGIGTATPGSTLDVKGTLRLSGSTSGYVGLAPAAAAGSTTYTLPSADGTNGQVLSTNGSGVMSWISPAGSVSSVFGRSGAVVATSGDYTATQVTNTAAGNIVATNVQTAINELDTEKQNVSTFAADVRAVVLTGLSTATNAAIAATDSVIVAFGKLQAQISGQATTLSGKADQTNIAQTITAATVTGLTAPVAGSDATNKTYVDGQITGAANQWSESSGNVYRSSGNVGIGEVSPTAKLQVAGTVYNASTTGFAIGSSGPTNQIFKVTGMSGQFAYVGAFSDMDVGQAYDLKLGGTSKGILARGQSSFMANVGIGTTTPGYKLDVVGTGTEDGVKVTLATNTSNNAFASYGGANAIHNMYHGASDEALYAQGYNGTTTNLIRAQGNSYFNGGNVGIGIATPGVKTQIASDITSTDRGNGLAQLWLTSATTPTKHLMLGYDTTVNAGFLQGNTYGSTWDNLLINPSGGNVGIGMTSAAYKLDVNGAINATSVLINGVAVGAGGSQWASGGGGVISYTGGNVGVGTTSPGVMFDVNKNSASGLITDYPILRAYNSNPTIGNGTTTFNRSAFRMEAGNGAVQGNFLASYETGGSFPSGLYLRTTTNHPLYFSTNNTTRVTVDTAGNVGVGLTNPDEKFVVFNGSTTGKYTATGWTHSSDVRLKHDITPIENSLEKILKLQGVEYKFKSDPENKTQIGFIAQEVEPVFPEVVITDKKGFKSMAYSNLVAPLVEAVKALYNKITGVEAQLAAKDKKIKELESRIEKIEKALNAKKF